MNYPSFNYKTDTVQPYGSNFLTTTHKLRSPSRNLRQPVHHRARTYRVPGSQRPRTNFSSANRQFGRYPNYSQRRMDYWGFNSATPVSSPEPPNNWHTGWKIINRIRSLITLTLRIVQYIQSKGHAQLASFGWSPGCCCGAVSATTVVIVVAAGVGIGVGLGVGLHHNSESINSTFSLDNSTVSLVTSTIASNISNATSIGRK